MNSGKQKRDTKGVLHNLRLLLPFLGRTATFFIKGRRWFQNIIVIFEKEIEERKRHLRRAIVFTLLGVVSLIITVLFGGIFLFYLVDHFLMNPPLSAGALFLFFLISGWLLLTIGIRSFDRVFSIDFEQIKRNIFD
jgi:hypothetical protein